MSEGTPTHSAEGLQDAEALFDLVCEMLSQGTSMRDDEDDHTQASRKARQVPRPQTQASRDKARTLPRPPAIPGARTRARSLRPR